MFRNSATAALIALLAAGSTAQAAQHEAKAQVTVEAEADGTAQYARLIAAIEDETVTPSDWSAKVAGLIEEPEIEILMLSEVGVTGEAQARELDDMLLKAGADIEATRTSIRAQRSLEDALGELDLTSDNVVAVEVSGDNRVTLYVDDSAM